MSLKHFLQAQTSLLQNLRFAMIGFGAQGEAEAFNLRRSGIPFKLGLRPDGPSFQRARAAGFEPLPIDQALEGSDSVFLNLPDQSQASIYQQWIAPQLARIKHLIFAHGFNTHFGLIPVETTGPQHWLIAPKGAASGLKEFYGTETALPGILATRGNARLPDTKATVEALALALGCHPKALVWADFKDEAECDLFSEQVLLCGGVSELLKATFEVMVEAGYNPETAYFESLYELKLIVDLIWKAGINGMRSKISPTARYGDLTRGSRVIDDRVKTKMREVLAEIQSGTFAKEFLEKIQSEEFRRLEDQHKQHPIEKIGERLRAQMKDEPKA